MVYNLDWLEFEWPLLTRKIKRFEVPWHFKIVVLSVVLGLHCSKDHRNAGDLGMWTGGGGDTPKSLCDPELGVT
jgi:hypothetical protein